MKNKKFLDAMNEIDASMILEAEPKEKTAAVLTPKKKRLKPIAFIAAAMLIVASLSVTAVANAIHSDMEPYWTRMFGEREQSSGILNPFVTTSSPTLDAEAIKRLEDSSSLAEDVVYVGDNQDVMFNIIGMTGGGRSAYIWFEVVLSDELLAQFRELTKDNEENRKGFLPTRMQCKIEGGGSSGSSGTIFLGTKAELLGSDRLAAAQKYATDDWSTSAGDGEAVTLVSRPDNTFCFVYRFRSSTLSSLDGKTMTLTIPKLTTSVPAEEEGDYDSVTLAEGNWQITMKLDLPGVNLIYRPDLKGQTIVNPDTTVRGAREDRTYIFESEISGFTLDISPILMQISVSYSCVAGEELSLPKEVVLVMADGSQLVLDQCSGGGGSIPQQGGIATVRTDWFFDMPIDNTQVVAVIYGGLTVPLTEDTLVK